MIRIPEPALVVLVGAAGAGKSTLAARHFAPGEVLSSDAYRAMVSGDPTDQRATRTAFAMLHRELERRLAAGRTAVVDATSVTSFARRALGRRATAGGRPAIAIVLDLGAPLVRARNATRPGRIVPGEVVDRHLRDLAHSLRRGLGNEGFAAIHVLRTAAEVDALVIERTH
ncbi:MAG TPA: AAA family ATPase [Candidatus Limnocylindria bacterium]|nr:AAA family ATPase [Candidatus Limnocylindria bacterium]